jgi:capsular exopolysaccharide synthesis family protein
MESNVANSTESFSNAHEPEDLNLGEIIRVVLTHAKLIFYVTAGFVVLALLYALFWPKTYEAITTVKVPDISQTSLGLLREIAPNTGSGDPLQTYVQIGRSQNVAGRAASILKSENYSEYNGLSPQGLVNTLLGAVVITDVMKSNLLSITARSNNPQLAADLANAWAQSFIDVNLDLSHKGATSKREFLESQVAQVKQRLDNPDLRLDEESKADEVTYNVLLQQLQQARLDENVDASGIVVVDTALKPERPISPKKTRSVMLALFLGLIAGIQLAFLLERVRDRIKQEDQLRRVTGLPNYAVVPDFREDYPESLNPPAPGERFTPKVLINNPVFQYAFYRESFKVLRTNLTYAQADKPIKALAVLSPGPEEGKTLVNANLAVTLAQSGKRVLLVDADLRKSSIRKVFGLENGVETGLPMALTGQKPWHEMIRPSGVEFLDLLPNTVTPPNPAELLGSSVMKRLIEEFKESYDYVVFDGAPVLPVTDSVVLSTFLDGVVLMARFESTRSSEVSKALEHLKHVGANVVGSVLNCVTVRKGLYGYEYRYGYGKYKYGYGGEENHPKTETTNVAGSSEKKP